MADIHTSLKACRKIRLLAYEICYQNNRAHRCMRYRDLRPSIEIGDTMNFLKYFTHVSSRDKQLILSRRLASMSVGLMEPFDVVYSAAINLHSVITLEDVQGVNLTDTFVGIMISANRCISREACDYMLSVSPEIELNDYVKYFRGFNVCPTFGFPRASTMRIPALADIAKYQNLRDANDLPLVRSKIICDSWESWEEMQKHGIDVSYHEYCMKNTHVGEREFIAELANLSENECNPMDIPRLDSLSEDGYATVVAMFPHLSKCIVRVRHNKNRAALTSYSNMSDEAFEIAIETSREQYGAMMMSTVGKIAQKWRRRALAKRRGTNTWTSKLYLTGGFYYHALM